MDHNDPELAAKVDAVIAEHLSLERRAAGLTPAELDDAAFLPPGTTAAIEDGENRLRVDYLRSVCLALELDPGEFVDACQREVKRRGI